MTSFSFSLNSISHFAAMALFLRALILGRGEPTGEARLPEIAFRPAPAAIVIRERGRAKERHHQRLTVIARLIPFRPDLTGGLLSQRLRTTAFLGDVKFCRKTFYTLRIWFHVERHATL